MFERWVALCKHVAYEIKYNFEVDDRVVTPKQFMKEYIAEKKDWATDELDAEGEIILITTYLFRP